MDWMIAIATIASLLTFVGIALWAWSGSRASANRESAMLPFDLPDEGASERPRKEFRS